MKARFLGGASRVGSLGLLLEDDGYRHLFDYGITPADPPLFPSEAPEIDALFLTHAHVDHSGAIPWLCEHQRPEIYATPPTVQTGLILMEDTIKVAEAEGHHIPFGRAGIKNARNLFRTVEYGDTIDAGGAEVTVHDAGHIPGAAMYEVVGHETILFTGDIHTIETNLAKAAKPVSCDTLIIESTYAGRRHPDRLRTEHALVEKVRRVADRGGLAIIPAFALGRTQELMIALMHSRLATWVDGMGKRITGTYLDMPHYLRRPKLLRAAHRKIKPVRNFGERRKAMRADAVITTSGMLDGGPVLTYLDEKKYDDRSAVLLTGYQVEGTNGRLLLEERRVDFYGVRQEIACEVEYFDLSAHADHHQLLRFIDACDPRRVVLMHGDSRQALANDLKGYEVLMPMEGEEFEL
ncbi:MAG: MBL fold metallo-hydrolase [Candidatus Thermoplasmatota archaeon]